MPQLKSPKRTPNILTKDERDWLEKTRKRSREAGRKIKVGAHQRFVYTMSNEAKRTAKWEGIERATFALCSDIDRRGRQQGDKDKARRVVHLLMDTFLLNEDGK